MGSLEPVPALSIPEDDLLLKNALEAGASFEALAKGAVRFSRRYTIQELQSRWHALLYDPDTSEQASAQMVELELCAQLNRSGDYKVNGVSGKWNDGTVRSHYYAMRKRIRIEPFSNVDLSFLDGPTPYSCQEQDTDFGTASHAFPQVPRGSTSAAGNTGVDAHTFHNKHQHSLEDEISDRIVGGNFIYDSGENVLHVSVNNDIESNVLGSFEHDNMHRNANVLDEKLPVFEINSGVEDMGPHQEHPGGIIFEHSKLFGEFNPVDTNPVHIRPGCGQSTGFSSPILDCAATVHQLAYSSPGPTVPIWRTMEDISMPSALNNENLEDRNKGEREAMVCPGADDKQVSCGYSVPLSDRQLEERTSDGGLKCSGVRESDFFEYGKSLFSFTNEVLLMNDDDGKDMTDRSCLDDLSLMLLSSPSDIQEDDIPNIGEHGASFARELGFMIPDVACPEELGAFDDKLHYDYKGCGQDTIVPPSMLAPDPHSPERQNGVICCTLNTEDPDIPCNDDAFLPAQVLPPFVSSGAHHISEEDGISFPSSSMDFSRGGIGIEQGSNHAKEEDFDASGLIEPQFLPAISPSNQITRAVTSEFPDGVSRDMASKHIVSVEGDPRQRGSAHLTPFSISAEEISELNGKVELEKFCEFDSSMKFLLESSVQCSDQNENDHQKIFSDHKHEPDVSGALQNHLSAEHGSLEMPFPEPIVNPSSLDQEVQPLEDDIDVPHFSDIQALILDMDLAPCCPDSYIKVSRYQHEEAKRALLRLEQGAYSYMQREILSHGAFAILYGRRLKHYIRKREVSLGRATPDSSVDIDLAKEGRANRISRRQAIIKMEDNGSFSLKNLGKETILVNGKEVSSRHCIKLSSGCLIEIRHMSFIFEANQKVVKRYLAAIAKNPRHGIKG